MDFEQLKKVDDWTRNIVSGYIRRNKFDDVPSLVIHCILAFYWMREYFEKIGPWIQVSDDNLTIEMQADENHDGAFGIASYGSSIIPSINNNFICRWKLQLTKY